MKKNIPNGSFLLSRMKSRLLTALTIVISVFPFRTAFAQGVLNNPVTIDLKQETLKNALDKIAIQGKVSFTYGGNVLQNRSKVSLSASNKPLKNVLDELLRPFPLNYTALENKIIIRENESSTTSSSVDSLFSINGRVFDTGEPPIPIPGATVIVKGGNRATTTNDKGNFELKVRIGEVLIFSHTGYKSFEYPVINDRDNLTIALPENVSTLDQVVVTGYSEQKLKHLANSISSLNVKSNIEGKPITQLSQALQGGITGLTVTQSSGLPGGDAAAIKIRGISTLGTTAPLVLVDGVPTNINDVDPVTVESVTVLKDAAAAAIYGSRAANGVIIVTTKRGQAGQVHIVYDAFAGFQKPAYLPEFVDAPTYMEMVNAAQANIGGNPTYTPDVIQKTRDGVDPLLYPNTDWKKLVLKNQAFSQQHSVGVTGGNSQARFAVNGTYLQQDGIIKQTSAERYSLRANTSVTLRENLSMYLDLSLSRKETNRPINRYTSLQDGDGAGYILYETFRIPPNVVAKYPLRATDGYQAYGNFGEMLNPIAELEKGGFTKSREDNISINFQPQWEILPGLKLKGQYLFRLLSTGNITSRDAYNFLDYYTNALLFQYGSTHSSAIYKRNYQYMAATLDYTKTYNKHTIYALGGITRETDNPDQSNQFAEATLASYFVKVNYIFNDKYLFESTLRTDGSSKFGQGNKWGYFPSVAAGWNMHKEPFMQGLKFISNLKLRTSYGLLGNNQGIGLYKYQSTTNTNGTEATIGNPDLTWESVKMLDAGVDIGLFKDKLNFTFDWYNKLTENILLNAPLSYSSGIGPQPINAGSVRNKGWEFAVNYSTNIKAVSLSFNAGYSYYKNTILTLKDGPYFDGNTIQKENQPIGSVYGYRAMGLLQQKDVDAGVPMIGSKTPSGPTQVAGDIRYLDLNNDGTITEADQTTIGNINPQANYFLNVRLGFKNFDVETLLNGFTASDVFYTGRYITPLNLSGGGGTPMVWQQDTWTPANTDAAYPRITPSPTDNARFSDYWRTNGAFIRIRFIQIGYTIKSPLFTRAGITNARIYFNTQNPFTFTGMKNLDPETKGTDNTYPLMRFYTLGVNIKL